LWSPGRLPFIYKVTTIDERWNATVDKVA